MTVHLKALQNNVIETLKPKGIAELQHIFEEADNLLESNHISVK